MPQCLHLPSIKCQSVISYPSRPYRDALDTAFTAGDRRVYSVFMEDRWIVISIGDTRASEVLSRPGNVFWPGALSEDIEFMRFADVSVPAKLAAKITSARPEGQHRRSWQKVVKGLLFDRVDAEAA
jgi:hypothetical protein